MSSETNIPKVPMGGAFPPYGFLCQEDFGEVILTPPHDWRGDRASYLLWFETALTVTRELLWPVLNQGTLAWEGRSVSTMWALTRLDLDVLISLFQGGDDILDHKLADGTTQRDQFVQEDWMLNEFGSFFTERYGVKDDGSVGTGAPISGFDMQAFKDTLGNGTSDARKNKFCGVIPMKQKLMRPRPYQTAMLMGFQDFSHIRATSASTPSMCSGHCLQGLVAVGSAMEALMKSDMQLSDDIWAALEQYAVDIGDRRVMARVHYPADSLCSWFMVITMAEYIFDLPEVKERLWTAISKRSMVYKLITDQGPNSPYTPFLKELQKAAK